MDRIISLYLQAARELKLPVEYREEFAGVLIKLGKEKYYFRHGYTPFNPGSSDNIALNKYSVNNLLRKANIPVPKATAVSTKNYKNGQWKLPSLNYPLVAKPTAGTSCGYDVCCNITNQEMLIDYLNEKADKYDFISLETFEEGLIDYRVVVYFGKVIAVTQRHPAMVIGNGKNTIAELIESENERRAEITAVAAGKIPMDLECQNKLKLMNMTLDTIPKNNEKVVLRYTCNAGCGGTVTALGNKICRENAELACKAAKLLSLNFVGLDILCEDIMKPIQNSRGFILEANANPDITINECALAGTNIKVAKIVLQKLIKKHPLAYVLNYLKGIILLQGGYAQSAS